MISARAIMWEVPTPFEQYLLMAKISFYCILESASASYTC